MPDPAALLSCVKDRILPLEDSVQFSSVRSAQARIRPFGNVVPFPGSTLDPRLVIAIGETLRAMYAEVACQPVPERLLQILQALETSDGESRS